VKFIKEGKNPISLDDFFQAGVHLGHRSSRWEPQMASFLLGSRKGLDVINLDKTLDKVKKSLYILKEVIKDGGNVLLIGNCHETSLFTGALGRRSGIPFVNTKWVGGTLTNWDVFHERPGNLVPESKAKNKKMIPYLMNFKESRGKRPDIVILLNVKGNEVVVREAISLSIPIIGIVDTDTNPLDITYPIPGNDDSVKAHYLYGQLLEWVFNEFYHDEKNEINV
jgi:small subunit ribosomal protein S2